MSSVSHQNSTQPCPGSHKLGTFLRHHHHQQVSVGAVRGEHRALRTVDTEKDFSLSAILHLLADLAPVAARGVEREGGEGHVVHAGLGELHLDAGQVVDRDGVDLAWQIAEQNLTNLLRLV